MNDHPTTKNDTPETPESPAAADHVDHENLQGSVPSLVDPAERDAAMDLALDYRGDITIETASGQVIEGYIFDRRVEQGKAVVRILPSNSDDRLTIAYEDIARLEFTGKDTAAGKSWETWVRKYAEKQAKAEADAAETPGSQASK